MKNLRGEIEFKEKGSIFDLFDNQLKAAYNITDDEYDYIAENMTDEELSTFIDVLILSEDSQKVSFDSIKNALMIRNKYLNKMKNKHKSFQKF